MASFVLKEDINCTAKYTRKVLKMKLQILCASADLGRSDRN